MDLFKAGDCVRIVAHWNSRIIRTNEIRGLRSAGHITAAGNASGLFTRRLHSGTFVLPTNEGRLEVPLRCTGYRKNRECRSHRRNADFGRDGNHSSQSARNAGSAAGDRRRSTGFVRS